MMKRMKKTVKLLQMNMRTLNNVSNFISEILKEFGITYLLIHSQTLHNSSAWIVIRGWNPK